MVTIPTISELYDDIINELQTEYGFTISPFGKVFLRALAMVHAARLKLVYLAIASVQKNIFPDTADPITLGGTLERFGKVKIGRLPLPATQGVYEITVNGEVGTFIPTGTQFKSQSSSGIGYLFITDTDYTLSSTTEAIQVRAQEAGLNSRLSIGNILLCTIPIPGLDREVEVTDIITHPTAGESIEEYRRVVLESFRLMPQGGAASDYRIWCQDAVGVKQSYPYAVSGSPNEIDVYIEATVDDSTDGMGTPTPTILSDAASVIETDPVTGKGRRPLGVFAVNVKPVIIDEITINISGYMDLTPEKETLIMSTIKERIDNMRPFIGGADVIEMRDDRISEHIIVSEILSAVPGSSFGSVEILVSIGGAPATPFVERVFDYGHIPFLIDINYV